MKKIFKKITQRPKSVRVKFLDNRQHQINVLSNRYIAEVLRIHATSVLLYFLLVNDNLICVIQVRVPLKLHQMFVCRISPVIWLIARWVPSRCRTKHVLCYGFVFLGNTHAGRITSCQFGPYRGKHNSRNPGDLYYRQHGEYHAESSSFLTDDYDFRECPAILHPKDLNRSRKTLSLS